MKFSAILGKIDPAVVKKAEDNLTAVFTEFSIKYDNFALGSGLGGDPLIFNLVYLYDHVCTEFIGDAGKRPLSTAATDGKRYYWNPYFVNELCEKSTKRLGLRFVIAHEAWHALYMHPNRRGSRDPRLWNIAVDYKVNATVLDDLKARKNNGNSEPTKLFKDNLGDSISFKEYADFLKDPFNPSPKLSHLSPLKTAYMTPKEHKAYMEQFPGLYFAESDLPQNMKRPENIYEYFYSLLPKCDDCGSVGKYKYPKLPPDVQKRKNTFNQRMANEKEQDLKDQKKKIEDLLSKETDEDLKKELEKALQDLNDAIEKNKQAKQKSKEQDQHSHGDDGKKQKSKSKKDKTNTDGQDQSSDQGQDQNGDGEQGQSQPGSGMHGDTGLPSESSDHSCSDQNGCGGCESCPSCGNGDPNGEGYFDPLDIDGLLDDHIDADSTEEDMAKKIADAIESTRKMAGRIPGDLEDELGMLSAPKITWQDFVRNLIVKTKEGKGRNDWTKPKSRPMFAGLYVPRQRKKFVNILVGIDSSGSMSQEDMAFAVSQLQCIDENGEGTLVFWDTEPKWKHKIKLNKFKADVLQKAKVHGRGGTSVNLLFKEYKDPDNCGEVDLIIIGTDGYLCDTELKDLNVSKGTEVVWLITSENNFKPPIGRVFKLRNE